MVSWTRLIVTLYVHCLSCFCLQLFSDGSNIFEKNVFLNYCDFRDFITFYDPRSDLEECHVYSLFSKLWARQPGVWFPTGQEIIFSFPKRPDRLWGQPSFLFNGHRLCFLGIKQMMRDVDTYFHLVRRLGINGALPICPPCTCMAWTGTILPLLSVLTFMNLASQFIDLML
jgi:hypothetical protein